MLTQRHQVVWHLLWVGSAGWSEYHSLPQPFCLPLFRVKLLCVARYSREKFQSMRRRSLSTRRSFSRSAASSQKLWMTNRIQKLRNWIQRDLAWRCAISSLEREDQANILDQEQREDQSRSSEGPKKSRKSIKRTQLPVVRERNKCQGTGFSVILVSLPKMRRILDCRDKRHGKGRAHRPHPQEQRMKTETDS